MNARELAEEIGSIQSKIEGLTQQSEKTQSLQTILKAIQEINWRLAVVEREVLNDSFISIDVPHRIQ